MQKGGRLKPTNYAAILEEKLSFCLFADDTNMLFADNNLRSLEATVNNELKNVCDWLTANKLTLLSVSLFAVNLC